MKGRRHTAEQVVRKLREADRLLAEGADLDAVCRHLEVSVQTYQRWRSQYRAMRPEDVVRLRALEKENALRGAKTVTRAHAAARSYSWSRPPRRSRRTMGIPVSFAGGSRGSGARSASARWGRARL